MNLLVFSISLLLGQLEVKVITSVPIHINPEKILQAVYDGQGKIYFTALSEPRILVCDTKGSTLPAIGKKSEGPDGFLMPMSLRYQHPFLYVSDVWKGKIFKVDPVAGTILREWKVKTINNFWIDGDQLILAYDRAQDGHVFGTARLGDEVVYGPTFYESPGLERVQGTKTSGILGDGANGLWVAYTGPYDLRRYGPDGRLKQHITDAPVDYVAPPKQMTQVGFNREGRSEHFRSFDKTVGIYACGELILLARFKHMEEKRLDCYYRDGTPYRLGVPIPNLILAGADDTVLYALQASSDAHETAADMNLVTLNPRHEQK